MRSSLCGILYLLLRFKTVLGGAKDGSIKINVINSSGGPVIVAWVDQSGGENIDIGELKNNRGTGLDTFPHHIFQVRETGECQNCQSAIFSVQDAEDQEYYVNDDFQIEIKQVNVLTQDTGNLLDPSKAIHNCRLMTWEDFEVDMDSSEVLMKRYKDCLANLLTPHLQAADDEIEFIAAIRENAAGNLENFTCAHPDMESSPDVRSYDWDSGKDQVSRSVHVKLDRPASRIHHIENFASIEECSAIEKEAEKRLHQASTADGKGGHQISVARKALQASIHPDWDKEEEGNLITQLSRRVYDFVNHVLDLDISHEGQEPLMSIQYAGRGKNDTEPDRYTPHCDGICEGRLHEIGGRMATMVIYCTIPERGGHTNFRNANVHIKPSVGSAVFFGYIDPKTKVMDNAFTTHSGCPVYEGEKKIVTQWVRYGVSKERHSDNLNSLGILLSEAGDV